MQVYGEGFYDGRESPKNTVNEKRVTEWNTNRIFLPDWVDPKAHMMVVVSVEKWDGGKVIDLVSTE